VLPHTLRCSGGSKQTFIPLEDISANQIKKNLINFKCFIGYSGWIEQRNKIWNQFFLTRI